MRIIAIAAILGLAGCGTINCDYAPTMITGAQAGIAAANIEVDNQAAKCAAIPKDDVDGTRQCVKKLRYLELGVSSATTFAASTLANVKAQCPGIVIPGVGTPVELVQPTL